MQPNPMRQFTLACCILGIALLAGSLTLRGLDLMGAPSASLKLASASVMILTLVLQLAFVIAQLFPAGRVAVSSRVFGPDAWQFILVATGAPGVIWHNLASYAGAPMNLIMPGFVTPIVTAVLLFAGRQFQQRNSRRVMV